MTISSRLLGIALLALAIAIAAGCGGRESTVGGQASDATSTSDEADGASSLSKAEFIRQAEKICRENGENFLLPIYTYIGRKEDTSSKSEAELAADAVRKTVLPKFQAQVDEISELDMPAGDEKQVEAFLAAMQKGIDSLESQTEISLGTAVDAAFKRAGQLAHAYGMSECL